MTASSPFFGPFIMILWTSGTLASQSSPLFLLLFWFPMVSIYLSRVLISCCDAVLKPLFNVAECLIHIIDACFPAGLRLPQQQSINWYLYFVQSQSSHKPFFYFNSGCASIKFNTERLNQTRIQYFLIHYRKEKKRQVVVVACKLIREGWETVFSTTCIAY
ncbi:hypothetical protein ABZP36_011580 [Zizania latifolia]